MCQESVLNGTPSRERPCQLLDEVLTPIPPKPNCTKKEHQEYIRKGVCNVLLAYDIDAGKRYLMVTKTKNKADYAHFMKWLISTHYPNSDKIKLVQDNYNTHSYGSFYENLPVEEARQIKKKLEFHYTPKHGSCGAARAVKYGRNRVFGSLKTMLR
ncbi:transposase [Runella sp.]|uniref:transposase n=1 Tax=Runella sp. TaxID=1960881 RepID=UPI003D0BED18